MKIEELKKGLDKGEGLNINYNIEDQMNEQISRYQDQNNQIKTLKINFWAQFKDLTKSKEGFKDRFNSILKQPIQYLTVSHTYGFLRGENIYSDTFKPFKSWIDNWKNLKSIRFELDEVFPEGYGEMDGVWGHWEYSTFVNLIKENSPEIDVITSFGGTIVNEQNITKNKTEYPESSYLDSERIGNKHFYFLYSNS